VVLEVLREMQMQDKQEEEVLQIQEVLAQEMQEVMGELEVVLLVDQLFLEETTMDNLAIPAAVVALVLLALETVEIIVLVVVEVAAVGRRNKEMQDLQELQIQDKQDLQELQIQDKQDLQQLHQQLLELL
jgi:hypothetical protein